MTVLAIATPDGAELCAESIGDPQAPAVLLIGGMTWSKDSWDDELCERLGGQGLRVLRYDHRDTGRSTAWPPGEPGYTGRDLTEDAFAVLDGFGVGAAHVVGLSMGGAIAQELGLLRRERVRSLTLIATSFAVDNPGDLPPPLPIVADEEPPEPDWADRDAVIDYLVTAERRYAGPGTFDEQRSRALAAHVYDRGRNIASAMRNHSAAPYGEETPGHLADLAGIPTLVVHGTHDPLFPIEHGRALAAAIPGARLLELSGMGHQLPPREHWDRLVDALTEVASEA